ncbi:tRNA 2-thiouridine(34) synthase MnmA, partial [Burkholderia multivorans]
PREDLAVGHLTGIRTSRCGPAPADIGSTPESGIDCEVQIRAHADPVPARAWLGEVIAEVPAHEADVPAARPAGQLLHVDVGEELSGVAPGQTMVIYRGTRVLGQATIDVTAPD